MVKGLTYFAEGARPARLAGTCVASSGGVQGTQAGVQAGISCAGVGCH